MVYELKITDIELSVLENTIMGNHTYNEINTALAIIETIRERFVIEQQDTDAVGDSYTERLFPSPDDDEYEEDEEYEEDSE